MCSCTTNPNHDSYTCACSCHNLTARLASYDYNAPAAVAFREAEAFRRPLIEKILDHYSRGLITSVELMQELTEISSKKPGRATLIVDVRLDPLPGMFHTAESARESVQAISTSASGTTSPSSISRRHDMTNKPECGEHDGTGWPCPTCDICDRTMCSTEDEPWNGETGNHVACEQAYKFVPTETLDPDDDDGTMVTNVETLAENVVGHRIVKVEKAPVESDGWRSRTTGLVITLDTGKTVTLVDTDDCCAYTELQGFIHNADKIDHIITGVRTADGYTTWSIFADMGDVLELTVGWSCGNPFYYGYGFDITIKEGA